jgi:hypothetical protein
MVPLPTKGSMRDSPARMPLIMIIAAATLGLREASRMNAP